MDNKKLGTVFNNDINNILSGLEGSNSTAEDYQQAVYAILDAKPGVLAQNVGLPEAVLYPTEVDNTFDKHIIETTGLVCQSKTSYDKAIRQRDFMIKLRELGTDPLTLTIEACRHRGVPVVASYRMNAEDWHTHTWKLSDFGRAHPEWRIPNAGALDPAVPGVYEHRLRLFTEVAKQYDIDGIEFDFRRWTRMISNPHENYPILTEMVRETRQVLDEMARAKKRQRLLLGVRVGPSLADASGTEYPGGNVRTDISCRDLGLDVKTWIEAEWVDYVCPSLFWPRWPGLPKTSEFVALVRDRAVGIYPTLFPLPAWLEEDESYKGPIEVDDTAKLQRYKDEICQIAMNMYNDGADGISTFNWYFHLHIAEVPIQWQAYYGYGLGGSFLQSYLLSILSDPDAIDRYRHESWGLPAKQ